MKALALAAMALVLPLLTVPQAARATCTGKQENDGICGNRELMALSQAGEAKLKGLAAAADPLTGLLMRRDQRWVMEMVAGQDGGPGDEEDLLRKKRVLERRLADLGRLVPGAIADGVAGRWINALGNAKIEKKGDAIAVEIVTRPDFGSDLPAACRLKADVKLGSDGWYTGAPKMEQIDDDSDDDDDTDADTADAKPADAASQEAADGKITLRLRLQANTLRVVIVGALDAGFDSCDAPDTMTGTYFLTGPGGPRGINLAARTVAPTFACAGDRNSDEEEICADPDLARLDVEITRAYRDTLKRLDARLAGELRDDQRAWSRGNTKVFDIFLHPYWDKRHYYVIQTGNARTDWETRFAERAAMLANLDEKRQGFAGHWLSYNAVLTIQPDPKDPGAVSIEGGKWVTGDYKSHCDFEGDGRVVGGVFKGDDDLPKLRRDGATLTIDGDDPDPDRHGEVARKQPEYCTRLSSAKARLFPVKPEAYAGTHAYDRIR